MNRAAVHLRRHRRAARASRSSRARCSPARCSGSSPGVLAPLIVARGMAFAVHGTAELAFTGGAAALLAGISVQPRCGGRGGGGRRRVRPARAAPARARLGDRRRAGVRARPRRADARALPGPGGEQVRAAHGVDRVGRLDEPRGARRGGGRRARGAGRRSTGRCCSPAPTPTSPRPAGVPVRMLSPLFAVLIGADDGAGGADRRGDPRARGHDRPRARRRPG